MTGGLKICHSVGVVLGMLAAGLPVAAQSRQVLHVDAGQSEVHWTLGATLHKVHGSFKVKGGLMSFDPESGVAQGQILVDAESGESGNAKRDAAMKKDQLETAKYPQVFFHPEKVEGTPQAGSTQTLTVTGTFNIHGSDHMLVLPVKVQMDGAKVTATTHFLVPYVDWGMKDASTMMLRVAKKVEVDVVLRGTLETVEKGKEGQ